MPAPPPDRRHASRPLRAPRAAPARKDRISAGTARPAGVRYPTSSHPLRRPAGTCPRPARPRGRSPAARPRRPRRAAPTAAVRPAAAHARRTAPARRCHRRPLPPRSAHRQPSHLYCTLAAAGSRTPQDSSRPTKRSPGRRWQARGDDSGDGQRLNLTRPGTRRVRDLHIHRPWQSRRSEGRREPPHVGPGFSAQHQSRQPAYLQVSASQDR